MGVYLTAAQRIVFRGRAWRGAEIDRSAMVGSVGALALTALALAPLGGCTLLLDPDRFRDNGGQMPDASLGLPDSGVPVDAQAQPMTDAAVIVDASAGPTDATGTDAPEVDAPPPPPRAGLHILEVFYNHPGNDNGKQWVLLYNFSDQAIDLAGHSIGAGGRSYMLTVADLSGQIAPYECFLLGGPQSTEENGDPSAYDLTVNFDPDLGSADDLDADAVAIFELEAPDIRSNSIPIDAVVYGTNNTHNFINESGEPVDPPDITGVGASVSIRQDIATGTWRAQSPPTPEDCPREPQ